jgi:L-ribulose-5-phosphate 4-epimerase
MAHDKLKHAVWEANMRLVEAGLVVLTFGNVSGADRRAGVMAIKPSGINYESLTPGDVVVLSLATGEVVEGALNPSSDTPTHLRLYQAFDSIGGVAHTHSTYASSWAQACRAIPCFGTTHADAFHGPVPATRRLRKKEIEEDYEGNTGAVIAERFRKGGLNPDHFPGVLVANHGPFTWGATAADAVEHSVILEEIARMAYQTVSLDPEMKPVARTLLDKHFLRKHGPGAYYGQK